MSQFDDLAAYAAARRLTGLALNGDGTRLVATMQQPDAKGARYTSSIWLIPLDGGQPVRLTHSDKGESSPAFLPDGSLLFTSARPDASGEANGEANGDDGANALWALPVSGEARVVARRPGGLGNPVVARSSGDVVLSGSRLTYSDDANDEERRATRKDRKVGAILHNGMPIRYWDHELGIESARMLLRTADGELRDLAPEATTELTEASYSISADGATIASTWRRRRRGGRAPDAVVVIDVASGKRTDLAGEDGWEFRNPVISPDGSKVALQREREGSFDRPPEERLVIVAAGGGDPAVVDLGDLTATQWVWSPDSATLYVAGDLHGRGAVLAVDVPAVDVPAADAPAVDVPAVNVPAVNVPAAEVPAADAPAVDAAAATVTRRLACDAVYSSLCPSPDGRVLYALRSAIDCASAPVRLDTTLEDQQPSYLPTPAPTDELPGELVELTVPAADGAQVHGWLCLPRSSASGSAGGKYPVMLWIHGGPFGSWNSWSWRWNPWVAVARGWAVVLPDPALSTGYGQGWLERAWPYVAREVYADCEAVLDAVLKRPDTDAERVACLGASFGGYMTNWVAGHVDRFGAIVTHAGLYALDQQHKTTDAAHYKTGVFGEPAEHPDWYEQNSPHNGTVGRTPQLVVHGNRDYRVPYSEALRLYWDLVSRWDGEPDTMPHRFLQFTNENHWILSPGNVEVWYHTVLGFCAQHVLGEDWTPSVLL